MLKKVFVAAAASAVLAGATITAPVTAQALTCKDAAKMKYPDSVVQRLEYRHDCRKAWKAATGKGLLNKLKS